jgi:hypothetical protein
MKHPDALVLVTPGALNRTMLANLTCLRQVVTHVIAPDFRQASRIANGLRAAKACRGMKDASAVRTFLVADGQRMEELAANVDDWPSRIVLLALSAPDNAVGFFRRLGAAVGVVTVVDELATARLFIEGDEMALRWARQAFERAGTEVTITEPGGHPGLADARLLLGPVFMEIIETASKRLRRAGLPLDTARDLIGKLALETLRAHQRSGARTYKLQPGHHLSEAVYTLGFIGGKSRAGHTD